MSDIQGTKLDLLKGAVVVGVDVAKRKHWARITDLTGYEVVKPFAFNNTTEGFWRLAKNMAHAKEEIGASHVVVGLEATGHYGKPLTWFLLNELGDLKVEVVLVNPMHVKRQKELFDNSPKKTDRKDTYTIAKLVRDGNYLRSLVPQGIYATLRELQVTRERQKKQHNSVMNRLRGWLDVYFPEFTSVFKGLTGKAAMWVLENCPTPEEIRRIEIQELVVGLKDASNNRVGRKRALRLRRAAEDSIGVPEGLPGARVRLAGYIEEIALWQRQLSRTEEAMAQALAETEVGEYLLSIPGVGVVIAAGLLGEMGNPQRYESWRQVQKLAGLNLVEHSSGQRKGQRTISKRGRAGLRSLLYRASLGLVATNPEFKALYRYFINRSENPLARKQALIAIGLKLLRVIFGLVRHRSHYDADKVLGRYRKRQIGLAS